MAGEKETLETTRAPRKQRRLLLIQQRVLGATSRPHREMGARTPQRLVQPAACRTAAAAAAAAGLHRTSAASAGRTGSLRGCTGHTSSSQTTGKSSALSCGTTPAPSVKPRGPTHTHAGTARRRSGRRLRGCCQGPGCGRPAQGH